MGSLQGEASVEGAMSGSRGVVPLPSNTAADVVLRGKTLARYRVLKTACMVLCWICMGAYFTMNTTAIDDLRMLIGCDFEQFSRAYVAKSVGTLLGSVLAGPVTDVFPRHVDAVLAASTFLMAAPALVLPLCPSLTLMGASFAVQGLGQAGLSASGNAHVLSMWGVENSSPTMALHFGYSVGNVVGPLLVRPFLMEHSDNDTSTPTLTSGLTSPQTLIAMNGWYIPGGSIIRPNILNQTDRNSFNLTFPSLQDSGGIVPRNETQSRMRIPYFISGGFGIVVSVVLGIFYCIGLPKEYQTLETEHPTHEHRTMDPVRGRKWKRFVKTLSPGSCTGGRRCYGVQMFSLIFLFFIANFGKDSALLTFTLPIAIDPKLPLHFTKLSADLLILIASVCACAGRLLFTLLAKCVAIQPLVFVQIFFILAAQIILVVWGLESSVMYWVGICMYNGFSSPLFPSGIVWADRYVKMTAVAVALVNIATGVSTFVFTYFAGYLFDYKTNGSAWVVYLSLGCSIAMTVLMVAMQALGSYHGSRRNRWVVDTVDHNRSQQNENEPLLGNPNQTNAYHSIQVP